MKNYIDAINKWNTFCKTSKLAAFPKPGSEQAILSAAADEATAYFDSLTSSEKNGETILTDEHTGESYRYIDTTNGETYEEVQ